tara:strand:+ start:1315 stop:1533 length:219 start_codon:yes stop_codon:yes gene_type:complete
MKKKETGKMKIMKATIEFQLDDPGIDKDVLEQMLVDHMVEILDQWIKGKAVITIQFETLKKEKNENNIKYIN